MTLKSLSICGLLLLAPATFAFAQETTVASAPRIISAGVVNGKAKNLVIPEYPAAARAVNAAGAVNVQVTIDEAGAVISAAAVSGHPLLRASAVQAARASQFSPTQLSGQPVKVTGVIVYNFVADQNPASAAPTENGWIMAGMLLAGLQRVDADTTSDGILSGMSSELLNAYPAEKARLAALPQNAEAKRQALKNIAESLESKLTGNEAWSFAFGKNLVGVMMQVRNPKTKATLTPDAALLRDHLSKIRELTLAAPANFAPAILDKAKTVGAFADEPDLTEAATVNRLIVAVTQLLDQFAPAAPAQN